MNAFRHTRRNDSGFSLVELMVGMTIGLIAIVAITQVSGKFQAQKNMAASGARAQNTGAISLYGMQREIEQAGYGFTAMPILGCSLKLPSGAKLAMLAPVLINDNSIPAGDKNTDTVLVAYSGTLAQTEGDPVSAHAMFDTYTVAAPGTFTAPGPTTVGDSVIAQQPTRPTPCDLVLDTVAVINGSDVKVASGTLAYSMPPGAYGTLYNMGPAAGIKIHAYAVRNGVLTECDFMANDCTQATAGFWVPIADNIVSLRAQYGRDRTQPAMDGIVDKWDQGPMNNTCDLVRVPAVRIALTARNSQFDKSVVTFTASNTGMPQNAPTWAGDPAVSIVGGGGALGPGAAPDEPWKHYRYRVFEALIPMRNVAWMGPTSGC